MKIKRIEEFNNPSNTEVLPGLKERLEENGGMEQLNKAIKLIGEESKLADNGEFSTETDVEYLHNGYEALNNFYEILKKMME